MAAFSVIIDNDSLCHLAYIDANCPVINSLKIIFSAVHIPDEILAEFETHHHKNPERKKIINEVYQPGSFFKKCSSFDTIGKAFLQTQKGIDNGEAAAAAQYIAIKSRYIISEDRKFTENINAIYPTIKILKLKHVFAMLDVQGLIVDWQMCISLLHKRRAFSSKELREAYLQVSKMYGIAVDKRTLSKKAGLKQLGILH